MKNLDITIVAPQGAGKSTLARGIFKIMNVTPERIVEAPIWPSTTADDVVECLRNHGADAVVFDVPLDADLLAVAEGVETYREITRRNVCAVYCIQATQKDFINYKS